MTIDVYPAHLKGNEFHHADDWNESSTMNMANGNFYGFFTELLGENLVPASPGQWKCKTLEMALWAKPHLAEHKYAIRMKQILAVAAVTKAEYICYA